MIIGLCGPSGSGKTSLGILLDNRGYIYAPFAEPIKLMLKTLLEHQNVPERIIVEMLYGNRKEEVSEYLDFNTPRHAMQTLGTEWGRKLIGSDFWLTVWENRIEGHENVVCDDVRHLNEAKVIRYHKGKVVRIMRDGTSIGLHSSEREYEKIDADLIIHNNGSIEEMYNALMEGLPNADD